MKFLLWCSFLSICAAALNPFTQFLILDQYGRNRNCHGRRCRRRNNNDNLLPFLFLGGPSTSPSPSPSGCFPDSVTFERLTASGDIEVVHPKELALGDEVKCLKAQMGPETESPEVGFCKFVSRGHNSNDTIPYHEITFMDNGEKKTLAMSGWHLLWATKADVAEEPIKMQDLKISNEMMVPIDTVFPGDVIVVESNNKLHYRKVISRVEKNISGINEPSFLDGGLPFVNGVLATTTSRTQYGGHWGSYFKKNWFHDDKFVDPDAAYWAFVGGPLFVADFDRKINVDNECFIKRILDDKKKGVDVSNFSAYEGSFAEVYVMPCVQA